MMWDRTLNILGLTYNLDQLNLDIENQWRLPRYLLFRQVIWDDGRAGDQLYLELMTGGSTISQAVSIKHIASDTAQNYLGHKWTLVELGWYDDAPEKGPYVQDILVYDKEGNYVDSPTRDKAARLAARALEKTA